MAVTRTGLRTCLGVLFFLYFGHVSYEINYLRTQICLKDHCMRCLLGVKLASVPTGLNTLQDDKELTSCCHPLQKLPVVFMLLVYCSACWTSAHVYSCTLFHALSFVFWFVLVLVFVLFSPKTHVVCFCLCDYFCLFLLVILFIYCILCILPPFRMIFSDLIFLVCLGLLLFH